MKLLAVLAGSALFTSPALGAAALFARITGDNSAGELWLIDSSIADEGAWENVTPSEQCSTGAWGGAGCSVGGYSGSFIAFNTIGCDSNPGVQNGQSSSLVLLLHSSRSLVFEE
ncbi:hypothetical protein N7462_007355 [Penicillium macrosclerotiorum]|uniref:uncharacterized protein n=1 Tax=Penicillium macrosclerotiorum TaxID=303699 RepID=UPI002546A208|nr:uncharacterized protein N7462_007355 [Penicillium macrosclerotiorum]KAJ5679111.1 hypothetical protein N7462_007355 [Penicillium macrosclerotiorum]